MMLITRQLLSELGFLSTLSRKKQTFAVLLIKCSKSRTGKSTGKLNPIVGNRITRHFCLGILIFHLNCSHALSALLSSKSPYPTAYQTPPLERQVFSSKSTLQLSSPCKCYHHEHKTSNQKPKVTVDMFFSLTGCLSPSSIKSISKSISSHPSLSSSNSSALQLGSKPSFVVAWTSG